MVIGYRFKTLKYQLIIISPKNKEKIVPPTRKGPNGICDFKLFFLNTIRPIPIIAPDVKAVNKAKIIIGKPKKRPIKKASLMSPKPIHFPFDIIINDKKKALAPKAANSELTSIISPPKADQINEITIAGKMILSGIM